MNITEDTVVQHIKNKEEQAIHYLIETYGGLLQAVIRKYLHGRQEDAEECLADVMVSVWYHIDSFDPHKNELKQWMAAIAKYKAIDYARRVSQSEKKKGLVFDETNYRTERPQYQDVEELLLELNETERTIFENYYLKGVSSKEIAKEFDARESWVHNKLSRGRKKLKSVLLKGDV